MSNGAKIGLAGLVALIAIFAIIYATAGPKGTEGSKAYTLVVVNSAGEETVYEGKTDAEYVLDAMNELKDSGAKLSFEGIDGNPGYFIDTVNGEKADFEKDGAYWAFYVNDEYAMNGVDAQPVNDGDTYKLVYEQG